MKRISFALAAGVLTLAPALADDSSAMLGAGGIVLTKNADIRMATEDLYLSPKAVKVHYTFTNDSGADVDTIVAFPLPDVDNYEFWESPIGTTVDSTPNFVGFKLLIDGKPVTATPEEHAILNGRDVTAQVRAAGLPINVAGTNLVDRIDKLSPADKAKLVKAGLGEDEGSGQVIPKWKATTKFWWKMHFPAHGTVSVDHTYQPVTGQTFFTTYSLQPDGAKQYTGYCIDAGTAATLKAKLADALKKQPDNGLLNQYTTQFVIKTANNWKGPIGRFHLTIDKLKPENVLSMCWAGDLKKTAPTRFESTLTNFAPKADIQILVVETPETNPQ